MSLKVCSGCARPLPPDSFGFRDKAAGVRHGRCRECVSRYSRAHYRDNREGYIDRAKKSNARFRSEARDLMRVLKSRPCADCGGTFPPYVMEFDHRDPASKSHNASDIQDSRFSRRILAEELAKCDVVCANCHRARGYARRTAARATG